MGIYTLGKQSREAHFQENKHTKLLKQMHTFITGQSFRCLKVPDYELDEENMSPGMGLMTSRISQFCSDIAEVLQTLQNNSKEPEQELKILQEQLQHAMVLQRRIESWYNSLSPIWKPSRITAADGKVLFTFKTRLLGLLWPLYYAVLSFFYIAVFSCCQSILSLQDSAAGGKEASITITTSRMARHNILQLIDSICSSIPYNLGEVDEKGQIIPGLASKASSAYYLIWPLALVVKSRHSTDVQSSTCSKTLQRIRIMYGIELVGTAMSVIEKKCRWLG